MLTLSVRSVINKAANQTTNISYTEPEKKAIPLLFDMCKILFLILSVKACWWRDQFKRRKDYPRHLRLWIFLYKSKRSRKHIHLCFVRFKSSFIFLARGKDVNGVICQEAKKTKLSNFNVKYFWRNTKQNLKPSIRPDLRIFLFTVTHRGTESLTHTDTES